MRGEIVTLSIERDVKLTVSIDLSRRDGRVMLALDWEVTLIPISCGTGYRQEAEHEKYPSERPQKPVPYFPEGREKTNKRRPSRNAAKARRDDLDK